MAKALSFPSMCASLIQNFIACQLIMFVPKEGCPVVLSSTCNKSVQEWRFSVREASTVHSTADKQECILVLLTLCLDQGWTPPDRLFIFVGLFICLFISCFYFSQRFRKGTSFSTLQRKVEKRLLMNIDKLSPSKIKKKMSVLFVFCGCFLLWFCLNVTLDHKT